MPLAAHTAAVILSAASASAEHNMSGPPPKQEGTVRFAAFNIEDVSPLDVASDKNPRLRAIAKIILASDADVILLNEIAYAGDFGAAERFIENYLGAGASRYAVFDAPSNTGVPSGVDLDRSGEVVTDFDALRFSGPDGSPPRQTARGRAFGGDAIGFGTYPGQYAMALLVDKSIRIDHEASHDLGSVLWKDMPGARLPTDPESGESWYSDEALDVLRLSSKSHWSVALKHDTLGPIRAICAHPTPPAFDGPERRNQLRNADEIRLLGDYLTGEEYLPSTLPDGEPFVILGDLNADAQEGTGAGNPIKEHLLSLDSVQDPEPASDRGFERLDPTDTAGWGKRADYVLPARAFRVIGSGVWRTPPDGVAEWPSDHFLVWVDLQAPQ